VVGGACCHESIFEENNTEKEKRQASRQGRGTILWRAFLTFFLLFLFASTNQFVDWYV